MFPSSRCSHGFRRFVEFHFALLLFSPTVSFRFVSFRDSFGGLIRLSTRREAEGSYRKTVTSTLIPSNLELISVNLETPFPTSSLKQIRFSIREKEYFIDDVYFRSLKFREFATDLPSDSSYTDNP